MRAIAFDAAIAGPVHFDAMLRTLIVVAIVFACCSSTLSAQDARVDTVLVLKTGQEVRGQFVGFRNGLFTLRLPDGRITIHGVGDVDRMQPADAPSIPAPARAPVAQPAPAAPAPAAMPAPAPVAAPAASVAPPAPAAIAPPAAAATSAAPAASSGLVGAALEARACGPDAERFPTVTDKSQHPSPGAPGDKGLVYVVRPGSGGSRIQTRLLVNGAWVGANYGNNYFFVTLDPGEHYFCSVGQDRSTLALTVEPGKIYYLQQAVTTGMMKSKSSLDVLADQDGREAVANTNLSTKREPRQQ